MRTGAWIALAIAAGALAGCADVPDDRVRPPDIGRDPSDIRVSGVDRHLFEVTSFDGTGLSTVAYVPRSADRLVDGAEPEWPVVVMLHGWGFFKEQFEGTDAVVPGVPYPPEAGAPEELLNILDLFARNGFLAVAYDARGFGASGGQTTMAGPAERGDLDAVLAHVSDAFPATDRVGLLGVSYGAGQALFAWGTDTRIDTAVSMFGWADLYQGLLPGNVPKLEWAQALAAVGATGAGADVHPLLVDWYAQLYTRDDLASLRAQMDARSALRLLPDTDKPLLVCQGMQESLFPQAQPIHDAAGGFTRTYVYTGGHNLIDAGCLERSLRWMHFWLAGYDTDVGSWPALETVDADGSRAVTYTQFPETDTETWYLREPDLVRTPGASTFTIAQRPGNPVAVPAAVSDFLPPEAAIPESLRHDTSAITFRAVVEEGGTLLGSARVVLDPMDAKDAWQVTGRLELVDDSGSRILARAAYSPVGGPEGEEAVLEFPFVKARLHPGQSLVLRLAANDPSWWMPLLDSYEVSFSGQSRLELPLY